jgi:site-specific recombinase XerD
MSVLPISVERGRRLTGAEFHQLAAVPAEAEWFANLDNPRTHRAYRIDLQDFMSFAGIARPDEFRLVTRAHVLAWRKTLEERTLSGATIRRKLAALSSLFEYLCEKNAVAFNPVKGQSGQRSTATKGRHRRSAITRRTLLDAPDPATPKGKRDRALLYHGLRREELRLLKVKDMHDRRGVSHLRIHGKGNKLRYLPLHPDSAERIHLYLEVAGHRDAPDAPLFQPADKPVRR